jgi:hypothetical protein
LCAHYRSKTFWYLCRCRNSEPMVRYRCTASGTPRSALTCNNATHEVLKYFILLRETIGKIFIQSISSLTEILSLLHITSIFIFVSGIVLYRIRLLFEMNFENWKKADNSGLHLLAYMNIDGTYSVISSNIFPAF